MISSLLLFRGSRQLHFHIILWKQSHISLGWGSVALKKSCKYVDFPHRIARLITSIQPCCAGRSYTVEEAGCRLTWTPAWQGSAWSPAFPGSQHTPASLQSKTPQRLTGAPTEVKGSTHFWLRQPAASHEFGEAGRTAARDGQPLKDTQARTTKTATHNSALHRCLDTKGKLVFVGTLAAVISITTASHLPFSLCQCLISIQRRKKKKDTDPNEVWSETCQQPLDGGKSHILDIAAPKSAFYLFFFFFSAQTLKKQTTKKNSFYRNQFDLRRKWTFGSRWAMAFWWVGRSSQSSFQAIVNRRHTDWLAGCLV